ncbi:MAG: hypothetical protein Q8K97_15540 [Pseudohongiella sp.]|nr:hypothetical protein [Pseudohongiella sp.]MDP2128779.1 hypothetical protein [Pseudohongiella sp.]
MKTEQQLDQAIGELAREIKPPRDLWLAIEPQLQDRQSAVPWYRAINNQRWAAVIALALVGTLWWSQQNVPQPGQLVSDPTVASVDQSDNEAQQLPADAQIFESFEQIKAQQFGELDYISPDAGNWQYQLAVWDQAILQVRGALEYYPEEPFLLAQMQGLYQQQLEYLQTISALDINHDVWMENQP